MYFSNRHHECQCRSNTFSWVRASKIIWYCGKFSHFLFLCRCKSIKPVIPAGKQALKDEKNEKSAETLNSTTDRTVRHHRVENSLHFVFRRSWVQISIKDRISLHMYFVVFLSSSKKTSEQQWNRPNPTTFRLIHYNI
jgi:hypothetical protein